MGKYRLSFFNLVDAVHDADNEAAIEILRVLRRRQEKLTAIGVEGGAACASSVVPLFAAAQAAIDSLEESFGSEMHAVAVSTLCELTGEYMKGKTQ